MSIDKDMDYHDRSYEPMDIDLSGNSAMSVDNLSYNEPPTYVEDDDGEFYLAKENIVPLLIPTQPPVTSLSPRQIENLNKSDNVRKYHIKFKSKKQSVYLIHVKKIISIILVIVSIFVYNIWNYKCFEVMDIKSLKETLTNNVYGQNNAIEMIVENMNFITGSKVLFLYGGTGVGKTYTASLIMDDIKEYSNVYHYTMPSFAYRIPNEILLGATMCKTSIFFIDDLHINDAGIENIIQDIVMRNEYLKKNVTMILIYNCEVVTGDLLKNCDEAFESKLRHQFKDIKTLKYFIKFNQLTKDHLIKCIEREFGDKLQKKNINSVLKNFNVSHDGCKGVHTKMKLVNSIL